MALPSNSKRKIFDGRYEVLSIVGRGTDSVVYHARHIQGSQQEVALKVLLNQKSNISLSERLRKEALTLVSCRHRYVVRLDDFHSVDDLCYLSMEYAAQGDLRKYLSDRGGTLPAEQGEAFLRQCLEALDFIHATGVIHRDIKPDNILVLNDKEARLADFGLALLPGDEVDIEDLQRGVGSFSYLPPEVVEGVRYDERSDLYSLGLCFYEALAGFHPFSSLPLADQLEARQDGKIPPLHEVAKGVPKHVSDVIARLIRYNAESRFQSALEAVRALDSKEAAKTLSEVSVSESTALNSDTAGVTSAASQAVQAAAANSAESFLDPFDDDDFDLDDLDDLDDIDAEPAPAKRESKATEEVDLARIKEILSKDAEQKASVAARRQQPESEPAPPLVTPPKQEPYNLEPKPHQQKPRTAVRKPSPAPGGLRRLMFIGAAAAALTVIFSAVLQNFPELVGKTPRHSDASNDSFDPLHTPTQLDSSVEETEAQEISFPVMPGGLYSGGIDGIIPGVRSPLALISFPGKHEVAVIVGIEGWSPSVSSTLDDGAVENHTLVVRSNGVVLNLTGELSSDVITGTFVNTMTGETGTWSAKKAP